MRLKLKHCVEITTVVQQVLIQTLLMVVTQHVHLAALTVLIHAPALVHYNVLNIRAILAVLISGVLVEQVALLVLSLQLMAVLARRVRVVLG